MKAYTPIWLFLTFFIIFFSVPQLLAQHPVIPMSVSENSTPNAFPLVINKKTAAIITDSQDAPVVQLAATALKQDIQLVTGSSPEIDTTGVVRAQCVIIGTLGQSQLIGKLVQAGKLSIEAIRGKWESYLLTIVKNPFPGVQQALVITGSDPRGTAYGVFELSKMIGVVPFHWWADIHPERRRALYVSNGTLTVGSPAVKYRGIFLNDEDWGLQPWAATRMDTVIKDIGPVTYERIFELLLRLRANFIWPAMHECTKAFYHYPDNPKLADQYSIIVSSNHCEPMLRSNPFEWKVNFEKEYGVSPGEWRYDTNKSRIYRYWKDRVQASGKYAAIYTVGMRGIHDSGLPGPKDKAGKITLMNEIIADQRDMLREQFGDATARQQIFCPYKEVLDLYQAGLKLPEDVTIVWPDDNFGYIRQLSTPQEQRRSGASGIYYHISYWGAPHDYLWLSTHSPALISYEMTKAFHFGADRFWVVNVGDIKPNEMETQFFMDLAWNVGKWSPMQAAKYSYSWAAEIFGEEQAAAIAGIKDRYYLLAQHGKPEHMRMLQFDPIAREERLRAYTLLIYDVEQIKRRLPVRLQSAFFQLVEYPVKGAAYMNQKELYARISLEKEQMKNVQEAQYYSRKAVNAFDSIQILTDYYNHNLENGKWNGIMSAAPRKLPVFNMPPVAGGPDTTTVPKNFRKYIDSIPGTFIHTPDTAAVQLKEATSYIACRHLPGDSIKRMPGLGVGGASVSRYPFTGQSFSEASYQDAPYTEYRVSLSAGAHIVSLQCLPTQAIHAGRRLGMAITINGQPPIFADINHQEEDRLWQVNVLRGYAEATAPVTITYSGTAIIRVYLLDTGLALNRLIITPR
ncbi:glycosyl hydrolase 115 family protein [Chitinophaga rhizophila]|uniref:Glycosyl hydrolase 115 family protein n=1 Tax=Chitinophaga rhizophila TaxID=2866212 RepID=A0ABS7GJS8_9BACT|nr:glycosyl hydrolase 115 family protein [Chitinophaga rhizophila]MBW8687380.1 glycosyl hydrolase 115 family protein [Chitinophaga rhizophila]